jgi:hypothetical protein
MAFQKSNTPRFVVTGSPRAMEIKPQVADRTSLKSGVGIPDINQKVDSRIFK